MGAQDRGRQQPHEPSCARQLRASLLAAVGDPPAPSTAMLHSIAQEIRACCGHHPLKCHRLAWGWSARQAVEAVHTMCENNGLERRGINERQWRAWESGAATNRTYSDLLSQLFATNAVQLGFMADYTPASDSPSLAPLLSPPVPEPARPTTSIRGELGEASTQRTRALLDAMLAAGPAGYTPPRSLDQVVSEFLGDATQVFTLTGPPGCGKTSFVYHAARTLSGAADFQLHAATAWTQQQQPDIAAEILRYAGLDPRADAAVELHDRARSLARPCIVVIDGVAAQSQFDPIGANLERILRLVPGLTLKFLLVIRTPPPITTSLYPVLDSSTYRPHRSDPGRGPSYVMALWSRSEARTAWDRSRDGGHPAFDDLPESLQQLARLPLYMRLLKTAGSELGGSTTAYRLVDHCVRASLDTEANPGLTFEALSGLARSEVPELAHGLGLPDWPEPVAELPTSSPLLHRSPDGSSTFIHDVIREYFLATAAATAAADRGRSAVVVQGANDLASHASTSATARGVFEFTVQALDGHAPELLGFLAASPIIDITTTLPLLMRLAGHGTRFATIEVWRSCAQRADEPAGLELARALLGNPACPPALGDRLAAWIISLLRRFGSRIWTDLAKVIESTVGAATAREVLELADLDNTPEATFVARHLGLFASEIDPRDPHIELLLGNPDWRVRAALVAGVTGSGLGGRPAIFDRLASDGDYKVRSAAAKAITDAGADVTRPNLRALLRDDNWHVRASAIDAVLDPARSDDTTIDVAVDVLTSDGTWENCPAHHRVLRERLLVLHGVAARDEPARQRVLFSLLREHRTGATPLGASLLEAVIAQAAAGDDWLASRESRLVVEQPTSATAAWSAQRDYRRLRGARVVQVALDLPDLDHAVLVAEAAARAGAELIEIGDPLIKEFGLKAVTAVKRAIPRVTVVAEMMSADWGRDQVVLAAQAGADVAFLIGPATAASVAAAVTAGRRMGVPVVLDVPAPHVAEDWVRDMESVGVDGFTVTTNIDLGVAGSHPFTAAERLRSWTRLPVAVSGGFSPTDGDLLAIPHWDIVIVGRSVAEAVNPKVAAAEIIAATRTPPSER